jgi:transketolase
MNPSPHPATHAVNATWTALARQLRTDSIRATTMAGSGHPTSAMSAADILAVLATSHLRYDFTNPKRRDNDRLIFSKGHAAPLLYALFRATGAISETVLQSLRHLDSPLEGHPSPRLPYVDAATGSLGQGLAIGFGAALADKHFDHQDITVWVLLGDSEMAEGSVYEAMEATAYYGLDNIVAIVDVNRLGQRGETALGWDTDAYRRRIEGFGWDTFVIDGHDFEDINTALAAAHATSRPACIIARTVKGRGVSFTADASGWHGRALTPDEARRALSELGNGERITITPMLPEGPVSEAITKPTPAPVRLPTYRLGDMVATREAYGHGLKALGHVRPDLVVLDAEVSNSTGAGIFKDAYPDRFFEMFIAEQLLISTGQGLSIPSPKTVFCSTFAAFLTRAHDQIRMTAVSRADLRICGSHAGISIGEDGPSQMGLEDIAIMRAICGSTVLYPADAVATVRLVAAMADLPGISYLRTTRAKTPVIYADHETFPVGGSKTLRSSAQDQATLIGAGITLHQALEAADRLAGSGIAVRVLDLYSVKPIDADTVSKAAAETGCLIVCEDHWAEGGLGEAVLAALASRNASPHAFVHLAVREMPSSGKPQELMDCHGISAQHMVDAVMSRRRA